MGSVAACLAGSLPCHCMLLLLTQDTPRLADMGW